MGAYEALWLRKGASFKTIAEKFAKDRTALPSDFVSPSEADECADEVMRILKEDGVHRFGVRVNHAGDYPMSLRDAKYPDAIEHRIDRLEETTLNSLLLLLEIRLPLSQYATEILFNRSTLELWMSKLVPIVSKTSIATRILSALTTALDTPVSGFNTHVKYLWLFNARDKAGASRYVIIKHNNRKSR